MYLPKIDDDGDKTMTIEFVDYGEPIDIKERKEVIQYLEDTLTFNNIIPLFLI